MDQPIRRSRRTGAWSGRQTTIATKAGETDLLGGTPSWRYRLDGLLDVRTWPAGMPAATVTYDAAARPTSLVVGSIATFTKAYDRVGNTVTEGRSISVAPGTNGGTDQTFTYDALDRLLSASLGATTTSYEYDLDGNRRRVNDATYTFNRADQLTSGPNGAFAYDRFGNLVTNAEAATQVSYAYDAADRLTSITAGATTASIGLDALGRMRSRTVAGAVTGYAYAGDGETATRIDAPPGGVDVDAVISAAGDRILGRQTSPTVATGWLLPDLHGNVAAAASTGGTVTAAIRYDGFGLVVGTPYAAAGSPALPFRYQGRLDIASDLAAGAPALYDMSARAYSPGLGAFTSLDSVAGAAQDPRSMNRYLYAQANPWTLVDPDGHGPQHCNLDLCDGEDVPFHQGTTGGGEAEELHDSRPVISSPTTTPPGPTIALPPWYLDPTTVVVQSKQDGSWISIDTATGRACLAGFEGEDAYCTMLPTISHTTFWREDDGAYYTYMGVDNLDGVEADDILISAAAVAIIFAPQVAYLALTETGAAAPIVWQKLSDYLGKNPQAAQVVTKAEDYLVSPHAWYRMNVRNVSPESIINAIENGVRFVYYHDGQFKVGYWDPSKNLLVSTVGNVVLTLITNADAQCIVNLKNAPWPIQ